MENPVVALLVNYARLWPFMIAHGAVLFFVGKSVRDILAESRELSEWLPTSSSPAPRWGDRFNTTQILDQFVAECGDLGRQGTFVPMTDFSDRLDERVAGLLTELSDRINMLLIVGIAGTMFGVFKFTLSRDYAPDKIGPAMSDAMGQAFPVGVMGLLLMLLAQLASHPVEERFRRAVAEATTRALEQRRKVTHSQAEFLEEVAKRIESALVPLRDLRATLAELVTPVVQELAKRLDEALMVIQEQGKQLELTGTSFVEGLSKLTKGLADLRFTADSLRQLVSEVPDVLRRTAELQDAQTATFLELQGAAKEQHESIAEVARQLKSVSATLKNVPPRLEELFGGLEQRVLGLVRELSDENIRLLHGHHERLTQEASETARANLLAWTDELKVQLQHYGATAERGIQRAADGLLAASDEWQRLAGNVEGLLAAPRGAVEEWQERVRGAMANLDLLGKQYPILVGQLDELTARMGLALDKASSLNDGLSTIWATRESGLVKQAEGVRASVEAAGQFGSEVLALRDAISKGIEEVKGALGAVGRAEQALGGLDRQIGSAREVIGHATRSVSSAASAIEKSCERIEQRDKRGFFGLGR